MNKKLPFVKAITIGFFVLSCHFSFSQFNQIGADVAALGTGDLNGNAVAIDYTGDYIVVGAPLNTDGLNSVGSTRVYVNNAGVLTQRGNEIETSGFINGQSGYAVDINELGTRIIIGSPLEFGTGRAYVFEWDGVSWNQLGTAISGLTGDTSGWSVSMSRNGNIIAIGEPLFDNGANIDAGRVRIFQWSGVNWVQIGTDIIGEATLDQSGWDVSLNDNGDRIAIGAPLNLGSNAISGAGHVRVYENMAGTWTQLGADIEGDNLIADNVGWSVDLDASGDHVVVGMPLAVDALSSLATGKVRVYNYNGSSWSQVGDDMTGELLDDRAGWNVSINGCGGRVAVGAPLGDTSGAILDSGHVTLYDNVGGNNWVDINPNNTMQGNAAGEQFGWSLDLDNTGNKVIVGAPLEALGGAARLHEDARDADNDGILGANDTDSDNDGIPNSAEKNTCSIATDTDGDLVPDYLDLDTDNDGINDIDEGGNGDLDTNNDGMISTLDAGWIDSNTDGMDDRAVDAQEEPDTDGDLVPNYKDLDSDNDGINDSIEGGNNAADTNQDGVINSNDTGGTDNDLDGITDSIDANAGAFAEGAGGDSDHLDTDNDSYPDSQDLDSDDDGVLDLEEANNGALDTNDDGTINSDDTNGNDTDDDGIADSADQSSSSFGDTGNTNTPGNYNTDPLDANSGGSGVLPDSGTDNDGDGIADSIDNCDNAENTVEFGLCNVTLSLEELEASSVSVFPVPAKEQITVVLKDYFNELQIDLYDLTGKAILTASYSNQGNNRHTFSLPSKLKAGIYMLRVQADNKQLTKKIVVK